MAAVSMVTTPKPINSARAVDRLRLARAIGIDSSPVAPGRVRKKASQKGGMASSFLESAVQAQRSRWPAATCGAYTASSGCPYRRW